jgi:hypothetical protein
MSGSAGVPSRASVRSGTEPHHRRRPRLGYGAKVSSESVGSRQGAGDVWSGLSVLDQPGTEIGVVANQHDRLALVPVQGVDERDEQRLPVGVRRIIQRNQPRAIDRLLPGCYAGSA